MNIGFIGLGRMGSHMARHLAEHGHTLRVNDLRPEAAAELAKLDNVSAAETWADAARGAEVVFMSLPGPKDVEDVVEEEGGLAGTLPAGSVIVDLSTNSPAVVRRLNASLAEKGIAFLDAPVSGGVEGAEAGTLSIMVGGDRAIFDRVNPLLNAIGTKVFHCGDSGAGSVVKLCNNICSAGYAKILGEALTLGVKAGVDLDTLSSVISASTGSSARLLNHLPKYLFKRNFVPGFSAALSAKDTRLALELAAQYDVPMAAAELARSELETALERGWANEDMDVTFRLQEERAGVVLNIPD